MSTAPMFDPYGNQQTSEKQPRSWLVTCLIGCLIMVVVMLVIAALVGYWISQNWRGLTSDALTAIIGGAIDASELPPPRKARNQSASCPPGSGVSRSSDH